MKSSNGIKMPGRVRILMMFFSICLFLYSCVTTAPTPDITFKHTSAVKRYDLKVALIINEKFKNATHESSISSSCGYPTPDKSYIYRYFEKKKEGVMRTEINVGTTTEELYTKQLAYIFDKVDIYGNISEIKNKNDYDYILVPYVVIDTAYDKEGALRRKIEPVFYLPNDHLGRIDGAKGTPLRISASVEFHLKVKDVKNGNEIENFTGKGSSDSTTSEARCGSGGEYRPDLKNENLSKDYGKPIGKAMSQAFEELLKKVEIGLLPLAKTKSEERALPSDLVLNVRFSDSSGFLPNNSLDAGEDAEMVVTIKNTGKGSGYGTNLEVTSDNSKIIFDKGIKVGDIQPNETKEIKVSLKAGLDIGDGKTSFQFNLKEKRGYDAKKVVAYVPTSKLERPQLEIISTEINDSETGLAKGNGNGIPESGETIELTAFIKNQGAGKAIGVNLNGVDMTSGIEWVRDSILVGTIQQGEIAKAKIAFTIPRNFDAKEITANLKVADSRGVSSAEKKIALSYAKQSPDIQYAYRVYSKGSPVSTITNGEEYEIELTINNKGQIPARNVVISLSSVGGMSLSRSKIDIGEIKERASISGQRFTLAVPRTFVETQAALNIKITQSDFSSVESSIQIPVDVKSPKLKYVANLLSKIGGNSLEQGENAILEIQILNEGNLSAEGVRIKLESKDENLKITGQTEASIGKIPANSKSETVKFQLSTFRRIKIGETSLAVNITQNDSLSIVSQYALNIREEGFTVVDIAGEEKLKHKTASTAQVPNITIKTPQNSDVTGDESIRLAFDVSDSRNIETIKVEVNGVSIPLDEKAGMTLQASKKKEILKNIPLKEGENRILITAYNADNVPARKELVVTRVSEDDVDTPPVTAMRNPDAVAVVIGISRYKNKDMPPVDYAKRDAKSVRNYLVNTMGYDEKRIIELYDEDADRTSLVTALYDDLRNRIIPGKSDVFVYYSGHGMPDVDSKEAEKDAFLSPYDFRPSSTQRTGIALKELYEQVEKFNARSVTIIMDSCFSGITEKGSLIKGISAVLEVSNPMLRVKNGIIFTASSSKEAARWYDKKQHGLFTYYFLLGLKGKADADGDSRITKKELEEFVRRNVAEQSQYRQNPTAMGNPDTVVVTLK